MRAENKPRHNVTVEIQRADALLVRLIGQTPCCLLVRKGIRQTDALENLQPTVAKGYDTLTIPLPLAKPADLPDDAPLRYHMLPQLIQVGNFANWRDVSRTLAPLFATKGAIEPGDPIAQQVADIEKAHSQPLDRALAALRVGQDQISYLANGMNGALVSIQPTE